MTAAQVREVIARLIEAGHWRAGDPLILVIFDAGYDLMRLACQLADLPMEVLGLAGPGHGRHDADHPVRHGHGAGLGPAASRLTRRSAWLDHDGLLPVIEGTLIRLHVDPPKSSTGISNHPVAAASLARRPRCYATLAISIYRHLS